jgi:hypothetical protein
MQMSIGIVRPQAHLLAVFLDKPGDVSRRLIGLPKVAVVIGVVLGQLHSALKLPDSIRQVPGFPQHQAEVFVERGVLGLQAEGLAVFGLSGGMIGDGKV